MLVIIKFQEGESCNYLYIQHVFCQFGIGVQSIWLELAMTFAPYRNIATVNVPNDDVVPIGDDGFCVGKRIIWHLLLLHDLHRPLHGWLSTTATI